jgi:hypothetical protein
MYLFSSPYGVNVCVGLAPELDRCKNGAATEIEKNMSRKLESEDFKLNKLGSDKASKNAEERIETDVKSSFNPEQLCFGNKISTNVTKLEHQKLIDAKGKETKNVENLCHLAENEDKDICKNVLNATAEVSSKVNETFPTTSKLSPSAKYEPLHPSAKKGEERENYLLNAKGKEKRTFLFPPQNFPIYCESDCISTARISAAVTKEGGSSHQNTSGVQVKKKEGVEVQACCKGEALRRTCSAIDIPVQSGNRASIKRMQNSSIGAAGPAQFNVPLSSVVHDAEESSELASKSLHSNKTINHGESRVNNQENNSSAKSLSLSKSVCECENWPPVRLTSSVDEVDVDQALADSTGSSSAELCVECGLPVASWASLQQEVILSVVRDREIFNGSGRDIQSALTATPPSTPPPPPPDFEVSSSWSSDLYLSREEPLSVDSPPSCDETSLSSESDVSTVIYVEDILQEQTLFLDNCDQVKTTFSQGRWVKKN